MSHRKSPWKNKPTRKNIKLGILAGPLIGTLHTYLILLYQNYIMFKKIVKL